MNERETSIIKRFNKPEDLFNLGIKALIQNANGQILLLKPNPAQFSNPTESAEWDLPGGRIHRGSTVKKTLMREIKEETGIDNIEINQLIGSTLINRRIGTGQASVGLILFIYECTVPNVPKIILSDEHLNFKWFSKEEAVNHLINVFPVHIIKAIARIYELR